MSRAATERMQAFVAGALTLIGLRALSWLPDVLTFHDSIYVVGCVGTGLGLPLGLAILLGYFRAIAVRLSEVYLFLVLALMSVSLFYKVLHFLPEEALQARWSSFTDWGCLLGLLLLLIWSRFARGEHGAELAAAPNGGQAAPLGNSEASGRPPSVS